MVTINLEIFRIPSNYVLIKPDPDFEFVVIKNENPFSNVGDEIKIDIGYTSETHGRHFGISGTVLKNPDQLVYHGEKLSKLRKITSGRQRTYDEQTKVYNLVNASMEFKSDLEILPGDRVWFDYLNQIKAVTKKLLVEVDGIGICFLLKHETIYCYEREGKINLINGWVWAERKERDKEVDFGVYLNLHDKNKFEPGLATVYKAAKPILHYLDGRYEDKVELHTGDAIVYEKKLGHPMEYALHKTLSSKELICIRRRHIYMILN